MRGGVRQAVPAPTGKRRPVWASISRPRVRGLFLYAGALRFGAGFGSAQACDRAALVFTLRMTSMGSFSIWHWMLFGAVALLLFGGKGKISDLMGDVAKGIKSFKKGMAEDDAEAKPPAPAALPLDSRGVTVEAKEKQKIS
jgi:sec-independent protein translocase protein TatA